MDNLTPELKASMDELREAAESMCITWMESMTISFGCSSSAIMIGFMLRKATGLPVVSTVHSDYKLDYLGRPFSRLTFGCINARALRKLDYRIGVSDAMVDLLISRGFPPDRFFTIYNGIDFTPAPDQGDRLEYLRSLGADVDEHSVVAGIAARMNPVKDMVIWDTCLLPISLVRPNIITTESSPVRQTVPTSFR